jgi:cytochrome c6
MKKVNVAVLTVATALAVVLTLSLSANAQSADLFKSKCAMCHGADGSASTGMGKSMGLKPLSGPEVQKMSEADLITLITNGRGKMPAYKGKLTDDQIKAVAEYVKTLK